MATLVAVALAETVQAQAAPSPPVVSVGLDRVASGEVALPSGRVGLVVHAASVTRDGRHAIEVLRERGVDLVRLFTPEHGLRGHAAAGEPVASSRDAESGLPVSSLYGAKRRPSLEDLADLDVLVFDLQDAGVRFYTYVSTLILTLEAVAESGVELVVLDRPNPLGGERIEGPVSAPRDVVPESFVNLAPGPLVHGLTLGEMARLVNAERGLGARLVVVPMTGWRRSMTWEDTGRAWTPPSPNLRSAEAALVYPGTALFEATTISEGRGTEAPFLLVGAPWLDPEPLIAAVEAAALEGVAVEPARFVPEASSAAPNPKHLGETCHGVRLRVLDAHRLEPVRLGWTLLAAASRQGGFDWRDDGAGLVRLLGTASPLALLRSGRAADEIVAADRPEHEAWQRRRQPYLLY